MGIESPDASGGCRRLICLRGPAIIHEPVACSLRPRKHRETFAPVLFVIPASLLAFGSRTPLGRARCPNQPLRGRTRVGNGQRSRRMLMECGGDGGLNQRTSRGGGYGREAGI